MTESTLNRRSLLGRAAAGAFAAASSASAVSATEAPCAAPSSPAAWDETFDVVVVGSGFAGLCAAYAAAKKGASVVVLKKMPTFGGNSIIDGSELSVTGAPQQKALGIEDSKALWMKDTLSAGANMNYPDKVRALADAMLPNYLWLRDEIGVEFSETALTQDGGHSVARSVITKNGSGSGYINPLLAKCRDLGVKCLTRQKVLRVLRNPATGRVEGVEIRAGYRFPKEASGKLRTICARRAVVLCHGRALARGLPDRLQRDPGLLDPGRSLVLALREGHGNALDVLARQRRRLRHLGRLEDGPPLRQRARQPQGALGRRDSPSQRGLEVPLSLIHI